jgi:chaperone modulatory protein CbpM
MIELCVESTWPDMTDTIGFSDLALACALSSDDMQELVEFGALLPLETSDAEPMFAIGCMEPLRAAGQLRRDYDLDLFVVVIVMDYLRRIEYLESEIRNLQVNFSRSGRQTVHASN